jgi:hypothetical protein
MNESFRDGFIGLVIKRRISWFALDNSAPLVPHGTQAVFSIYTVAMGLPCSNSYFVVVTYAKTTGNVYHFLSSVSSDILSPYLESDESERF